MLITGYNSLSKAGITETMFAGKGESKPGGI